MLNYRDNGKGKKQIIFVHGNSQSYGSWSALLNDAALTENYKLIAMDLPGHGDSFRSKDPVNDYSLMGMSRHLKEFISNFDKEEYILVANSLGSNLVGEIAHELANCKGIMITGSSAVGKGLTPADIIKPNPNLVACFMAAPTDEQIDLLINDMGYNLASQINKAIKLIFRKTDPEFRVAMAAAIGQGLYSDELANFEKSKIPIAVVFGKEEKLLFTDHLDKIPFKKWKDKTILIENSGHFSQLDQPKALAAIVGEFAQDCLKQETRSR